MKRAFGIAFGIFVFALHAIPSDKPSTENQYVKFTAAPRQRTMAAGSAGALLFNLRPQKGIHVNLDPPVSLAFDSTAPVQTSAKIEVPKMRKVPYLDTTKSIVQRFTLSKRNTPATVTLSGVLTYFYCSDAEGWCSKFKQPFAVTVTVTK